MSSVMLQRPGRSQRAAGCCSYDNKTSLARDYSKKQNPQPVLKAAVAEFVVLNLAEQVPQRPKEPVVKTGVTNVIKDRL